VGDEDVLESLRGIPNNRRLSAALNEEESMRILLAVDGSGQSCEAVRALSQMAHPDAVILVHAIDVPAPAHPMIRPEVARDLYMVQERRIREEGERVLRTAAALLPPNTGPMSKVLEVGKPVDVILSMAEQERIDLIVMGARGIGALRELMLGSVSHRVVTHAPCSVLVVAAPLGAVRHIVLAIDGAEETQAAVRVLQRRPFKEMGGVTVLTVIPYAHPAWPARAIIPEPWQKEVLADARRFAEEVASSLTGMGYHATGTAIEGPPASSILETVVSRDADLIIMGSRHRGLGRAMMGSVSHAVLHRAPCPVLIVR
jgi:nucleotide-binding universal stress UspA family protein